MTKPSSYEFQYRGWDVGYWFIGADKWDWIAYDDEGTLKTGTVDAGNRTTAANLIQEALNGVS